jgi:hypothetical protein
MLDAYRDLIDELLGTPSEIRGLVEATDEDRLPPEAHRLIAELRGRDRMMLDAFQTMTRKENPYLGRARPAEYAPGEPLPDLLDDFDQARGDLVSLLINLSLKDWERSAIHETEGEVSLADEVESHVEFDESQRQRLRDLLGP